MGQKIQLGWERSTFQKKIEMSYYDRQIIILGIIIIIVVNCHKKKGI
jgi:hypothetical protein